MSNLHALPLKWYKKNKGLVDKWAKSTAAAAGLL